jgi:diaminopimelate decarboxylase
MNQEGAGGDAFGVNEMYFALLTGMDGRKLVLNGSNKEPAEIEMAVRNRVCINIDAWDELDMILGTAERLGLEADVGVRLKLELKPLENRHATELHGPGSLAEQARNHKWGMPYAQTVALIKRIQGLKNLHLKELSYHLSRMDNKADDFAVMAREMVQWMAKIRDDTGWVAPWLDLGGGWTFGRPEKTGPLHGMDDETTPSFEDYAEAVCLALEEECKRLKLALPGIKIEPGRSISGPAGEAYQGGRTISARKRLSPGPP